MSKTKLTYHYNCTESELYSSCRTGWHIHEAHLAVFFAKKPFYTNVYSTAALAEIDAAMAIPDFNARKSNTETLRVQLVTAADDCRVLWQDLKSHIEYAYDRNLHKIKIKAAGGDYYSAATKNDWEEEALLMNAGLNFINENEAKLLERDNMPPTFKADYTDSINIFIAFYDQYKLGVSNGPDNTRAKVNANNAIYDKYISMSKDARRYFRKEPAIMDQFLFENILKIISRNAGSGLTGTIIDSKTGGGLGDVALSLFEGTNTNVPARYTTHSEGNGAFSFGTVASGNYTLRMEYAGLVTRNEAVELKVGVSSSKTFMMNA